MRISGLAGCDTTRAARKALAEAGKSPQFRDLRENPPGSAEVAALWRAVGPALLNKASATWRGLSEAERSGDPVALMAAHPALVKRPVIEDGDRVTVGWGPEIRSLWLG